MARKNPPSDPTASSNAPKVPTTHLAALSPAPWSPGSSASLTPTSQGSAWSSNGAARGYEGGTLSDAWCGTPRQSHAVSETSLASAKKAAAGAGLLAVPSPSPSPAGEHDQERHSAHSRRWEPRSRPRPLVVLVGAAKAARSTTLLSSSRKA